MLAHSLLPAYKPFYLQPIYFLAWWYGRALVHLLFFGLYLIALVEDQFSIIVMFKAILTLQPLHQDFSIVGRGIGVVIRLLWICVALVAFALALIVTSSMLIVWILLPPVLVLGLVSSFYL